jgi:acetolactate synthase-1/2/3 large subunit
MPAVGSFAEDHVLAMGVAGTHGTGYANLALANCDVLLAVGTRFDDRLTGGVDTFAPEAEILHVDVDASEFHKNVYADYPLLGDAGTVLDQLTRRLSDAPAADEWRRRCRQWKASHPLDYDVADDEPVKPQFVVEVLDAVTPDETIVTSGVGQHQVWACHYWTFRHPDTWISSHGLGTPGYGLPAAIGARVAADDDRTVVCFEGDRSFLMTVRELAVAVREHLDITVAVVNDSALGLGRQSRDAFDDERRAASERPWVPAFDRLAEAFGARGFRVDEFDEVAETVEDALAYDGPSVVDFHVDPEEDVFPFVASGGDGAPVALREEHL